MPFDKVKTLTVLLKRRRRESAIDKVNPLTVLSKGRRRESTLDKVKLLRASYMDTHEKMRWGVEGRPFRRKLWQMIASQRTKFVEGPSVLAHPFRISSVRLSIFDFFHFRTGLFESNSLVPFPYILPGKMVNLFADFDFARLHSTFRICCKLSILVFWF